MSWHYLRVQEVESLEDICSGGELLQPLKSKTTHAEFYCNGKLMDSYLDSLSGTTSAHLMENLGEEKSMSSQVDSHVKTYLQQEKELDLMEKGQDSGKKWQGSFVKYNLDTSSWRTHQCSLLGGLDEFLETWPKWGLMRNGECWEVTPLESTQNENEYGFWPTPTKSDGVQHGKEKWIKNSRSKRISLGKNPPTEKITYVYFESNIPMKYFPELSEELMTWPKGWTLLEPLGMDKYLEWRQRHGGF